MPAELYPPVAYAPQWLTIGIAAVALALVWPLLAGWLARVRPPRPGPPPAPVDPEAGRTSALQALDRVGQNHRERGYRASGQEISRIVRGFVAGTGTVAADTMTLDDLRTHSAGPDGERLTALIALLYPPNFGPDQAPPDIPAAVDAARRLVQSWGVGR